MNSNSRVFLHLLFNRFHKQISDGMLRPLAAEDRQEILDLKLSCDKPEIVFSWPEKWMNRIHVSWMETFLEKLQPSVQTWILGAFAKPQAVALAQALKVSYFQKIATLNPVVKSFLLRTILTSIDPPNILPLDFLPETPLKPLGEWTKQQLVELIECLSMYDLADEVRFIIEKNRISQIHQCLSAKKKQFLHICMHQKEKMVSSRLDLSKWKGDTQALETLLHHRGLVRLGKALCGQHPDFIKLLTYTLDKVRGKLLMNQTKTSPDPKTTPYLMNQVINVMNFLQPQRPHA